MLKPQITQKSLSPRTIVTTTYWLQKSTHQRPLCRWWLWVQHPIHYGSWNLWVQQPINWLAGLSLWWIGWEKRRRDFVQHILRFKNPLIKLVPKAMKMCNRASKVYGLTPNLFDLNNCMGEFTPRFYLSNVTLYAILYTCQTHMKIWREFSKMTFWWASFIVRCHQPRGQTNVFMNTVNIQIKR